MGNPKGVLNMHVSTLILSIYVAHTDGCNKM